MAQPVPVPVEDGSEITRQAWGLLEGEGKDMGLPDLRIQPISEFLQVAEQHRTGTAERQLIIQQACLMFDHLYPHMPFKTDIYRFIHPSDYLLQNVQPRLESMNEIDFHTSVINAFSLVRDAHTLYGLPSPYRGAVAFLPFQMRPYLDRQVGWRFIVTSVMHSQPDGGSEFLFLRPGAEIVNWGELSTLAHVQRTEENLPGGNYFASFTRGAIHSTLRPLTFVRPPFPDELPEVTLHYRPAGHQNIHVIRIPWAVGTGFDPATRVLTSAFSVSPAAAMAKAYSKLIHRSVEKEGDQETASSNDPKVVSTIPDMFEFQYTAGPRKIGYIDVANLVDKDQPGARFGYIRIKAFSDGSSAPGSTDRIVQEFRRITTLMDEVAPDGLVIDIRGNPGGDVLAAEQLLQMLTARLIEPARFHLANTAAVLDILRTLKISTDEPLPADDLVKLSSARAELAAWLDDAEQTPLPGGSPLTTGKPLTDPDSANNVGQIYHGRGVVLLIDSLTYSAADIFAAGFQDHEAGILLGTSLVTGGGGANVWSHDDLLEKLGPSPGIPLAALPGDTWMSLAIRRCSRVGPFDGQPVEDQGVNADVFYLTESIEDLVTGNPGILQRACQELRHRVAYRVDAGEPRILPDGNVGVDVNTTNIASLQFFLNGHSALTIAVDGRGMQTFVVPCAGANPSVLRIEGSAPDANGVLQLVRARTIRLQQPVEPASVDPATESITGTDLQ